jgi:hypothetical protein
VHEVGRVCVCSRGGGMRGAAHCASIHAWTPRNRGWADAGRLRGHAADVWGQGRAAGVCGGEQRGGHMVPVGPPYQAPRAASWRQAWALAGPWAAVQAQTALEQRTWWRWAAGWRSWAVWGRAAVATPQLWPPAVLAAPPPSATPRGTPRCPPHRCCRPHHQGYAGQWGRVQPARRGAGAAAAPRASGGSGAWGSWTLRCCPILRPTVQGPRDSHRQRPAAAGPLAPPPLALRSML